MDDTYRLKIKIGIHEFEAEGPVQVVQAQFAAFKELVATVPATPPMTGPSIGDQGPLVTGIPTRTTEIQAAADLRLDKIMRLEDRVVSLTARPDSTQSALLLLLYGQKILRQNDAVTGMEINDGISATGGLDIYRPDRILEKMATTGDVIVIGERRGKTYRLTNAGFSKARQLAQSLIATVA